MSVLWIYHDNQMVVSETKNGSAIYSFVGTFQSTNVKSSDIVSDSILAWPLAITQPVRRNILISMSKKFLKRILFDKISSLFWNIWLASCIIIFSNDIGCETFANVPLIIIIIIITIIITVVIIIILFLLTAAGTVRKSRNGSPGERVVRARACGRKTAGRIGTNPRSPPPAVLYFVRSCAISIRARLT